MNDWLGRNGGRIGLFLCGIAQAGCGFFLAIDGGGPSWIPIVVVAIAAFLLSSAITAHDDESGPEWRMRFGIQAALLFTGFLALQLAALRSLS